MVLEIEIWIGREIEGLRRYELRLTLKLRSRMIQRGRKLHLYPLAPGGVSYALSARCTIPGARHHCLLAILSQILNVKYLQEQKARSHPPQSRPRIGAKRKMERGNLKLIINTSFLEADVIIISFRISVVGGDMYATLSPSWDIWLPERLPPRPRNLS